MPLFLIALAVAQAEEARSGGAAARLVAEKIGYGVVGGAVAETAAPQPSSSMRVVRGLIGAPWRQVVPLAGAGLAFGLAEAIGGSRFIAAFVGEASTAPCETRRRSRT